MELIIFLFITCLIGAAIGQARDRTAAGFGWGLFLGPIGWLIVLLGPNPRKEREASERRDQERRIQEMQEAHLFELRELRKSLASDRTQSEKREDMYWVRLKDRDVGPIGKLELIELYSSGKIVLDTQVALDVESEGRVYRLLSDEIPALKKA